MKSFPNLNAVNYLSSLSRGSKVKYIFTMNVMTIDSEECQRIGLHNQITNILVKHRVFSFKTLYLLHEFLNLSTPNKKNFEDSLLLYEH